MRRVAAAWPLLRASFLSCSLAWILGPAALNAKLVKRRQVSYCVVVTSPCSSGRPAPNGEIISPAGFSVPSFQPRRVLMVLKQDRLFPMPPVETRLTWVWLPRNVALRATGCCLLLVQRKRPLEKLHLRRIVAKPLGCWLGCVSALGTAPA